MVIYYQIYPFQTVLYLGNFFRWAADESQFFLGEGSWVSLTKKVTNNLIS